MNNTYAMDEINNLFDPRTPAQLVEAGKLIIGKGLETGISLGETINAWIDAFFDIFND